MMQTRMSKNDRHEQLLTLAAEMVTQQGADRLTLQTLAERAGVSKPITYNHFGDRKGLLTQLYQGYDDRLIRDIRAIKQPADATLADLANTLAVAYFRCVVRNGHVYDAVIAALCSYPDFTDLRTRICRFFVAFYREHFGSVADVHNTQTTPILIAIYGASDELARAVTNGDLVKDEAVSTLTALIVRLLA